MIGPGFAAAAAAEMFRGILPVILLIFGGLVGVGFLAGYLVFG